MSVTRRDIPRENHTIHYLEILNCGTKACILWTRKGFFLMDPEQNEFGISSRLCCRVCYFFVVH